MISIDWQHCDTVLPSTGLKLALMHLQNNSVTESYCVKQMYTKLKVMHYTNIISNVSHVHV